MCLTLATELRLGGFHNHYQFMVTMLNTNFIIWPCWIFTCQNRIH